VKRVLEWLHDRTGYRSGLAHLLDEPLPAGTGWWFTFGSVLLFLIALQAITGIALSLYYAPTPDHAHASVQFIMREVALGSFVRGLHYFGASAVVIFAALHMLRVIGFGSYKPPREATWLTGIALLLIVLAFALTGYLLPWDQRAYWATVVTINITRLAPVAGDFLVNLAGAPGGQVGALTLSRWFAIHVIVLPAAVGAFVILHLFLLRRHGISGPVRARTETAGAEAATAALKGGGYTYPFYPYQAARDVTVISIVAIVLAGLAWRGMPELERMADPTDATYVPRPEWYFLGLFQLLKFMPGWLEIVGALLLPGLVVGLLALLPWIDRSAERDPRKRPMVLGGVIAGLISLLSLTAAGWFDRPERPPASQWTVREVAGAVLADAQNCARCHSAGRVADPLAELALTRPIPWLQNHVADPEVIAPGIRPMPARNDRETDAIIASIKRGGIPPETPQPTREASLVMARHCIGCHVIDGDGGTDGPDLSHIGRKRDVAWLRRWIARPKAMKSDAEMPAFDEKLSGQELDRVATYLGGRQ
jgi:ubiquinol-cytochrome c reductase cytochrome b subunit